MATRRKRSRGGRSGARAGGPPTSNALEWAERLARGEEAPQPSALEWAEGLAHHDEGTEAAAGGLWAAATPDGVAAPAPGSPFGRTDGEPGTAGPEATSPFGATSPEGAGGDQDGDAPGWGPVRDQEPAAARSRRGRGRAGGEAKGSRKGAPKKTSREARAGAPGAVAVPDAVDGGTPPAGDASPGSPFPGIEPATAAPAADVPADEPAVPARSRRSARSESETAGRGGRRGAAEAPGRTPGSRPAGRSSGSGPAKGAGKPAGTGRSAGTAKGTGTKVRRVLSIGLPRSADKPTVLVLAAVVAVVLGLGVGWTTNYFSSGQNLAAATPQQCAAAQTAWTKAANAQTGISEDDPASVRSGFIEARDAMATANVPPAITEDWEAAHTFYATVADALEEQKAGDAEGIAEAAQTASTKVDTEDMIATSKRITRYVNAGCNV